MRRPERVPIAFFLTSFDAGGTERQMTELVRRLDRTRFDVHVACFHRRGPWLPRVQSIVGDIAEFPIRSFRSPSALAQAFAFGRWCRRRRIAVVQAADLYANGFALLAARAAGVRVRVGSRREVHPSRGRSLEFLQRLGYSSAHRIVANSEAGAARLRREGIAPHKIAVVRNGLDLETLSGAPRPRGFRLITVARLRPEKAHEVLIAAVARVRRAVAAVQLQIVGNGEREAALRAMVAREGLEDCVEFLGHREDVAQLLQASDYFVLPSRIEAAPNAALEAMAAGLPVVASDVGGIPEVVTDGVTGLLVPPDSPDALAGALFRLFDDPALADRLARAGREHVAAHYSFDRMVAQFESLYLAELARRRYAVAGVAPSGVQTAA